MLPVFRESRKPVDEACNIEYLYGTLYSSRFSLYRNFALTSKFHKMPSSFRFIGLLLLFPFVGYTQVLDVIDVHLNISEKVEQDIHALPNATLQISDIGQVSTDPAGNYAFTYPVRNQVDPIISISLVSEQHKMLKPVDGSIALDPTREEMFIEFLVVNMESQSPAFQERIKKLEKRISGLQAKNALTTQQLNALNSILLDTILYYEANRVAMENQIADFEKLTTDQQEEITSLKTKISGLEDQVDQLTLDLEAALEARYLRQNDYYKRITANLLAYLRKAKDLRDHLPFISTYFSSSTGYQNFDKDIKAYNSIWEEFDNNRMSYVEGVDRYWENNALARDTEDVFEFLVKSIHQNQLLTVIRDINVEIHKRKPKKAQKIATSSHEDMTENIRSLEKRINRVMLTLRKNI